uniref:Peptidase C1A papain C-terminal domain-containing protein n=1 Tax=Chromera velia CCMP2878 TaxID=1169474 RepID=A0A0G4G853_9ALVE|eukprot:Cvel_20644.t1-p1 / transcript=Cvel_20644.t1 / gene=Cvel_20644 / organism=Chromera_velia_CCMP2878 / gene_product=Cysteine proteinase 1, putative / transcript_product=Cysteine proteinase 1, putative / location=Cvel_scaffold1873:875-5966(+) / protein_length=374 / sequence_SO=supercontig / SO=protein_coding / is_pseudo=false
MLPEDVDWRRRYTVTAVKDQGKCGSCWAFAAAETVESYWARASGELQDLSVQQILDCAHYTEEEDDNSTSTLPFHALSSNDDDADDDAPPMRRPTKDDPDDDDDDDHHKSDNSTDPTNTTETNVTKPERGGCQGGGAPIAAEVVDRMGGLETEWKYPYTSYMGKNYKCRYTTEEVQHVKQTNSTFRSAAQVHDWLALPLNNYAETLRHVALHGPLFVVVDASAWKFYATGVFNGCPVDNENVNLNHAVQLIGYGEDDTLGPYWLVRNSWAAKWGDGGFIRLRRVGGGAEFCGYDTFPLGVTPEGDEVFARQKVCGACGILIMPSFVRVGKPDWMPVNPEGPLPSSLSPRLRGGNVNVNAEKGEREPEREDILLE